MKLKQLLLGLAAIVFVASGAFLLYYNWQNKAVDLSPSAEIVVPGANNQDNLIPDDNLNAEDGTVIDSTNDEFNFDPVGITVDQTEITAAENALYVSGMANTFEATVNFRLYGEDDVLIVEDMTMANREDVGLAGPFSKQINFNAPDHNIVHGYLQVFEYSAMDGTPINMVTVPVYFEANDYMEVTVFFQHSTHAGDPNECTYVQSVKRWPSPQSVAVAKTTLEQMLLGPNTNEKNQGFFSGIPAGTRLNSVRIENRIAYVDFSAELNHVAGSCAVGGVISMIEANLLQFDTVDDVVISINGASEDILQP